MTDETGTYGEVGTPLWTEVVKRGKRAKNTVFKDNNNTDNGRDKGTFSTPRVQEKKTPKIRKNNAVVIIKSDRDGPSCSELLSKANREVSLDELDISDTKLRKADNGGTLIELSDPESRLQAVALANKLMQVFPIGAIISVPTRKSDLRLTGFHETTSKDCICETLSDVTGCNVNDIRIE